MRVMKFVYNGSLKYDIHYTESLKVMRYACDDEPKLALTEVLLDLSNYISEEVVGLPTFQIKTVEFIREDKRLDIKVSGKCGSRLGDDMDLKLAPFGYNIKLDVNKLSGAYTKIKEPHRIADETGIELIDKLEAALIEYVKNGASQLDLFEAS